MPASQASIPIGGAQIRRGRAGGGRWEMAVRPPAVCLRPYVRGDYVGYTEWSGAPMRRHEYPGPFAVLVIEFGPPLRIYECGNPRQMASHRGGFVGGICDTFVVCEHDGFQRGVQVHLSAIGARLLFGIPMSELCGGPILSIRDVLPVRHRRLGERLQETPDWDERFDLLDEALADCLTGASERTRVVSWAVRRIEESGGCVDVGNLARELGYSHKHMIAMFRDQVGVAPKLLARLVRFDRLMQHLRRRGPGSWADLAAQFGYYDQAHLVREVQRFTGTNPTAMRPLVTDLGESIPPGS